MKKLFMLYGLTITIITMVLSGCSSESGTAQTEGNNSESMKKVSLIEAWYSKGEDGGYFGALQQGYYEDKGIDMTIEPGGPEVSAMQLVAAGKAEFGISYADDLLKAREEGIPVVGILAAFQTSPRVFLYHPEKEISGFDDLNGMNGYVTPGSNYWEFVKGYYHLDEVSELNYNGQLSNFLSDDHAFNQAYITNEPYALSQQGVDVSYLKIADSGYANYANVLFTTEQYLKENPDIVEAVVQASQEGWGYYLENYETVNPLIQEYNPDMSLDALNYEGENQKELISTDETDENGLGYMSVERWEKLQSQLLEIGALDEESDVTEAFTTEFLSNK